MEYKGITTISNQELLNINGGHKGFFYKTGVLAAGAVLFGLGILTGISEGFDEGVKS